jgi:hypothetical protein
MIMIIPRLPLRDAIRRRFFYRVSLFEGQNRILSDSNLQRYGVLAVIGISVAETHFGACAFSKSAEDRFILKQAAFFGSLVPAVSLWILTCRGILLDDHYNIQRSIAEDLMAVAKQYPGRSHFFLIGLLMMSSVCGCWIQQYQEWPTLALSDYLLVSGVAAVFSQLILGSIGFMAYKLGVVPQEQRKDLSLWQFFGLPDRNRFLQNDDESLERGEDNFSKKND